MPGLRAGREGGRLSHKIRWRSIHRQAGCHSCWFADREKLDRDACCTYPGTLAENKPDGSCGTWRAARYLAVKRMGGVPVAETRDPLQWFPELQQLLKNFTPSEIVIRMDDGTNFEITRQDR